jgi:aryl-alcohol dehydrogenase-like predicted oxidoreductase
MVRPDTHIEIAGARVPRIGLGTNRLTPRDAELVRGAVAAGAGMIDTAHLYTDGESETAIGEALNPKPQGTVVATKGGYEAGTGAPEVLSAQIEQSLRRLRSESLDLYYLHRVDPETPLERSLETIAAYRERGQITDVGISAVDVEQIERAREVVPIAAVQNHYSLAEREHDDVLDHCAEQGIVFVPYFPLRGVGGAALEEVARAHDATPQQIALAWLLRRSPVTLPIPGTLSLEHLKQNLGALEVELSDQEFEALA